MHYVKNIWDTVFDEPFHWLLYYFFQPDRFMEELRMNLRSQRIILLLRLVLPMFFVSYLVIFWLNRSFSIVLGCLVGIAIGIIWDILANLSVGIVSGIWLGIFMGIWMNVSWQAELGVLLTTIGALALGTSVPCFIPKHFSDMAKHIESEEWESASRIYSTSNSQSFNEIIALAVGIFAFVLGGVSGIALEKPYALRGYITRIGKILLYCIAGSMLISMISTSINSDFIFNGPIIFEGCIVIPAGVFGGIILTFVEKRITQIALGIGGGLIIGSFGYGALWNDTFTTIVCGVTVLIWCGGLIIGAKSISGFIKVDRFASIIALLIGTVIGIIAGLLVGGPFCPLIFLICYSISYCRLPLYPTNLISPYKMHENIQKNPSQVFTYLHQSLLHWDKHASLPFVFQQKPLEECMIIAVKQDIMRAMEEISLILAEKPYLDAIVLKGLSEIIWAIRSDPSQIFAYLHLALGWDKHSGLLQVSLEQFLEDCMAIAAQQDAEQARIEISFILARKPHLQRIAQIGLLEIIIHGIEVREDTTKPRKWLRDIVDAASYLAPFFLEIDEILDFRWVARLNAVHLAIQDAQHFSLSLGWQTRYDALLSMISNLQVAEHPIRMVLEEQEYVDLKGEEQEYMEADRTEQASIDGETEEQEYIAEGDFEEEVIEQDSTEWDIEVSLISRLQNVMANWIETAQHELERLDQEPHKTNQISDPYVVGPPLDDPGTSLFVGRRDLAQHLEDVLGKRSHRPTFFLIGERRMGKTSTLKQLPSLLDTRRFLPIFYDLLAPGMISSAPAFLATIAEALSEIICEKEMQFTPLTKEILEKASEGNEATVYFVFDEWLKQVEAILDQNDQVALLSFDEFERLEKVEQENYFDLDLLLNWFRSIVQNRPRLALLFSGGKAFDEMQTGMGMNWSGYFVHVQMLKVSFLQYADAHQLITRPLPDYPIAQIFGEGVVDEIIRVTYGHPFLVQAICSALVNNLNAQERNRSVMKDVEIAINDVLEDRWGNYFQDLWNRTDQEQRACMIALYEIETGDQQQIKQYITQHQASLQISLPIIRRALRTLVQRDLVLQKDGHYHITAPIFSEWVKRNR